MSPRRDSTAGQNSIESIELGCRQPLPASTPDIVEPEDIEGVVFEVDANLNTTSTRVSVNRNETDLKPVDVGFGAWSFSMGAFFVESIVWALPNSFGVFLAAYLDEPLYTSQSNSSTLLPLIGPLSSGIIYCSGFIIHAIMARFPRSRRVLMWLGTALCWSSLLGASYATKVTALVALQGLMYSLGASLLYMPCISYMSEWFVARRGLANGVIFSGTAAGGLILPLVLTPLLKSFGISKTLRILSVAFIIIIIPILPFIRGRLPESRVRGPSPRSVDRSWMREKMFWVLLAVNTIQGFAYFIPIVWLPTFAGALNLGDTSSSLSIALLNGASVVSRLSMGSMSDKFDPWILALLTLLSTSVATFVLWGVLSSSLAGLLTFSIAYGALAGGWSSLWTAFTRPIAKDDPTLTTSLFGILLLTRGLGNVLSTPIATSLSSRRSGSAVDMGFKLGFDVAGGRYEKMIVYVGTCFAGAAVIAMLGFGLERQRA